MKQLLLLVVVFLIAGCTVQVAPIPQNISNVSNDSVVESPINITINQSIENPVNETVVEPVGITAQELAQHSTKDDCWVAYKGEVYDVTSFLPMHPGGVTAIAKYCGTDDFEAAFNAQHGDSKERAFYSNSELKGVYS